MRVVNVTFNLHWFLLCVAAIICGIFFWPVAPAESKGNAAPYIPQVIEVQKDHAWCYVLVNQNKLVGNIHALSCVPIFQRR